MGIFKKLLKHPSISENHIKIARNILASNKYPKFMRNLLYRVKNYLPPRSILMNIKFNSNAEVIYEVDLKSYIGKEIFYGTFEPAVTAFYRKILKNKKVVWDIGSNIGYYAVMAGILLKGKGEVFAFEPVPINFSLLEKNVKLNNLSNVKLFKIALSSEDGEADIYLLDTDRTTGSPTLNKEWAQKSKLYEHITITTKNPMSLITKGEIKKPDIIKIDAETYEPIILESIKELLEDENAPDIISEIMPPTIEPMQGLLIEECGYDCYHINDRGITKVDEIKMRRPYNDYFFTKSPIPKLN